jgi:predicted nucleic acid-binding protein
MELALAHYISIYDACYAALAYQLKLPLVSADQALKRNLVGSEIQILDLSGL